MKPVNKKDEALQSDVEAERDHTPKEWTRESEGQEHDEIDQQVHQHIDKLEVI